MCFPRPRSSSYAAVGSQRDLFDRHERSSNRTSSSRRSWSDLEHVVDSLLTELGDSSRYAELWARSRWSNLDSIAT